MIPRPPAFTAAPAPDPRYRLVTAGGVPVVALDDVKTFLKRPIEDTFWDAETTTLITVAEKAIEQFCQITLAYSVWEARLPQFWGRIRLRKRPFVAVSKVEFVDPSTGVLMTLPSDNWIGAEIDQECGMLFPGSGITWPETAYRPDGVRITFSAGYAVQEGDAEAGARDLPDDLRQAIFLTVAALDRKRGDGGQGGGGLSNTVWGQTHTPGANIIPMEARSLLAPYRYRAIVAA